jgi:hypothetical protein
LNRSILLLRWLNQSRVGYISGSTLRTRSPLKPMNMDWLLLIRPNLWQKLTSRDALPSETEAEEIKPLLARIQELKNAMKKELNGTQLIVFFLQWWIQPLQARVSKLWTYSSLTDPSRVSQKDPELKDLKKMVRSLTTLTAKKTIPNCLAVTFDTKNPLPKVLAL